MRVIPKHLSKSIELPCCLVTGASGMLGSDLSTILPTQVIPATHASLDITDVRKVKSVLDEWMPGFVINAAAYTNVDGAESEREKAYAINVTGPQILAAECERRQIRLVHFSTDQVFDGNGSVPWKEGDPVNPSNYYAETKYLGEQEVLKCPEALVLRVQWLYGKQKNRFTTLRQKAEFTPFADQFGAPTWTDDIALVVTELMNKKVSGLFHFAYDDFASWAEVFALVRDELKLTTKLIPKATDDVKLPAKRPKFSVLSNQKILTALGWETMGSWKDSLREFLRVHDGNH